jgi:hypothetical protein
MSLYSLTAAGGNCKVAYYVVLCPLCYPQHRYASTSGRPYFDLIGLFELPGYLDLGIYSLEILGT